MAYLFMFCWFRGPSASTAKPKKYLRYPQGLLNSLVVASKPKACEKVGAWAEALAGSGQLSLGRALVLSLEDQNCRKIAGIVPCPIKIPITMVGGPYKTCYGTLSPEGLSLSLSLSLSISLSAGGCSGPRGSKSTSQTVPIYAKSPIDFEQLPALSQPE